MKIDFYSLSDDYLDKAFFSLAEKCYESGQRLSVVTKNSEETSRLNDALWTFAKKKFIPHGSDGDPYPEEHPIYLSDALKNPNGSEAVIFFDPENYRKIAEFLTEAKDFKRIIFIYRKKDLDFESKIEEIISPLRPFIEEASVIRRSDEGAWERNSL